MVTSAAAEAVAPPALQPLPGAPTSPPDTTITNNPDVACVWNHLMDPNLSNGLRSILSGFFGPNDNVTFSLSDTLQSDDMCKYLDMGETPFTPAGFRTGDPRFFAKPGPPFLRSHLI